MDRNSNCPALLMLENFSIQKAGMSDYSTSYVVHPAGLFGIGGELKSFGLFENLTQTAVRAVSYLVIIHVEIAVVQIAKDTSKVFYIVRDYLWGYP